MFKTSTNTFLLLMFVIPFLNGCLGYNTIAESKPIDAASCIVNKKPAEGWENIPVYDDEKLFREPYRVIAKVTVTGNRNSYDEKLIEKMQQEASRYNADAIIFKNWQEVERSAVNGVAIGINILSLFNGGYVDLNMGGDYIAYEYEGIAIQFYK